MLEPPDRDRRSVEDESPGGDEGLDASKEVADKDEEVASWLPGC